jgi:regulator of replication initiation timing
VQHTTQRQQELEQQLAALSARLSQATKDLLTAKTQSDLQIEAINARNAAIASITGQKNGLEQNCGELSRAAEELRARLAEVLNESHQLRAAAQQTDAELQRAHAQLAAQAAAAKVVVPSTSSISSDTLLSCLQCPLCEQLLIDAVVLPCSHGFCRACVESRWAQSRQSASSSMRTGSAAQQRVVCTCPRCDAVAVAGSKERGKEILDYTADMDL